MTLQQTIEAGKQHQELEAGRASDAAMDAFVAGVVAHVEREIGIRPVKVGSSMGSHYFAVDVIDADGEMASVEFRVSNHAQRYSGPVWSFTAGDDERSIRWGIDAIREAIEEARG